jgi:hypothetical protein
MRRPRRETGGAARLQAGKKFEAASRAYVRFLELGGEIALDDLTPELLDIPFEAGLPILTGLSATHLYNSRREYTNRNNRAVYDDLRGEPTGHFVVLCGHEKGKVRVADPFIGNPLAGDSHYYDVGVDRLVRAILLGVMTYDANLLVIANKRLAMKRLIVVDDPKAWTLGGHDGDVVSVSDYLSPPEPWPRGVRVFNLARSYGYQTRGYYVSLLAEARGHRVSSPMSARSRT